jgi:Na+/H+ antiporter NhaD/arsenite permease-like protein
MVAGLEAAGFFEMLVHFLAKFHDIPTMWFGVILIWFVAICSAVVDNIPITIALIPVILGLAETGINSGPLWWALAFGAGLGGNGTILGSSANIVVANMSERTRTPITSAIWVRIGLPAMIVTCTIASILFVLAYPIFTR